MRHKITYIYFLHKGDNIPFYIGKSVNPSLHRSYQHKYKYGKDTILEVIDEVSTDEWIFWESFWINQMKQWGFSLLNLNNGGGGSINLSEEIKKSKSTKMKKLWECGNFKRKSHKKIIDNQTGIIYNTIKDLLRELGKEKNYKSIYKKIGPELRYSYLGENLEN
jgi:hypothetical protein